MSVLDRWCRDLKSELVQSGVAKPVMGVGYPSFNSSIPGCTSAIQGAFFVEGDEEGECGRQVKSREVRGIRL